LARYAKVDPKLLRFALASHAKPELSGTLDSSPIRFNLSQRRFRVVGSHP
jgi:hypothetical protein